MLITAMTRKKAVLSSMINKIKFLFVLLILGSNTQAQQLLDTLVFSSNHQKTVFVLTATAGYVHKEAIPAGKILLQSLAKSQKFNLLHSNRADSIEFLNGSLIDTIIFLCTTQDIFNEKQQKQIENYIKNGGGFIGIHAAADTEYEWPWYGKLVGAYFESHPPGTPSAIITTLDPENPITNHLPKTWEIEDEWYNFTFQNDSIQSLLNLEETSYKGGKNGEWHPITWFHDYDGGRSFYTGMGHKAATYNDIRFIELLQKGLAYTMKTAY